MTTFQPSRSRRALLRTAFVASALTAVGQLDAAARPAVRHTSAKPHSAPPAPFPAKGSVLVLLGTKGGPTPSPLRAAAANALVIDG